MLADWYHQRNLALAEKSSLEVVSTRRLVPQNFLSAWLDSALSSDPCGSRVCARLGSALLSVLLSLALVASRRCSLLGFACLSGCSPLALLSARRRFAFRSGRLGSTSLCSWLCVTWLGSALGSAWFSSVQLGSARRLGSACRFSPFSVRLGARVGATLSAWPSALGSVLGQARLGSWLSALGFLLGATLVDVVCCVVVCVLSCFVVLCCGCGMLWRAVLGCVGLCCVLLCRVVV